MDPTEALSHRSPHLIRHLLTGLDEAGPRGLPTDVVIDTYTSERTAWRTVDNLLRELGAFGAIQKLGGRQKRVRITDLGRHYLQGTKPPKLPRTGH